MSVEPGPLALVLLAALMHAGWNLIAKAGGDRLVTLAVIKLPNVLVSLGVLAFTGLPAAASVPFLALSCAVNSLYFYCLARAYRGDLSLAYPIARGLAPLCVLPMSLLVVSEWPSVQAVVGVGCICAGVLALALGSHGSTHADSRARHRATLRWAVGMAVTIALYTVIDGMGARRAGSALAYVAALSAMTGAVVCAAAWLRRPRHQLAQALRAGWGRGLAGGVLMLAAYGLVVHAMTRAPLGQVAALRESSVVMAALLGVLVLREPLGMRRVAASVLVAAGIIVTATG